MGKRKAKKSKAAPPAKSRIASQQLRERLIQLSRSIGVRAAAEACSVDYATARQWRSRYAPEVPITSAPEYARPGPNAHANPLDTELEIEIAARRYVPPVPPKALAVATTETSLMHDTPEGINADASLLKALDALAKQTEKRAPLMTDSERTKATKAIGELLLAARVMNQPLMFERVQEGVKQLTEGGAGVIDADFEEDADDE